MSIDWHDLPELRSPGALVAFSGWGDAANAATGAVEYLMRGYDGGRLLAQIGCDDYLDFTQRRPIVSMVEGGTRRVTWPDTSAYGIELEGQSRDLVVVLGDEPHLAWRRFAATVIELLQALGVSQVVTLGAFIGQVAHTLPVPVVGVIEDPELLEQHSLMASNYEGPTGIVGVLNDAFVRADLDSASLWAAIPHYLAANPNPRAMLALLQRAAALLGVAVETTALAVEAAQFQSKVDEAVLRSSDLAGYVRRLEQAGDQPEMQADAGAELVTEIEHFLRGEDG
jgi:proteasome assembly chaperone (PAC2) family protein